MDAVGLQTLHDEMRDDCRVVRDALDKAQTRFARGEEVAYELRLDPDKLALLLKYARQVADRLPGLVQEFVTVVGREQQIEL